MTLPPRIWVSFAITAALVLVIGANWHLVNLAFRSQPGCVTELPGQPAAKPEC